MLLSLKTGSSDSASALKKIMAAQSNSGQRENDSLSPLREARVPDLLIEAGGKARQNVQTIDEANSPNSSYDSNLPEVLKHTILGRITELSKDFFKDDPKSIISVIRSSSRLDRKLMKDQNYRNSVLNLLGGESGNLDSSFSQELAAIAREEIKRFFAESSTEQLEREASWHKRITLAEAASGYDDFLQVRKSYQQEQHPIVFAALLSGTAEQFSKLSDQEQRQLRNRIEHLPEVQRKQAKEMFSLLRSGQDIASSTSMAISHDFHLDALRALPAERVLEHLLKVSAETSINELYNDAQVIEAVQEAFGSELEFEKFAKPIFEGLGLSAQNLRDLHFKPGIVSTGQIQHLNYYSNLKLLSAQDRERIIQCATKLAETAAANDGEDPESNRYLNSVFKDMTQKEREIAVQILQNEDQEITLVDKIRARAIGADINQEDLLIEYNRLSDIEKTTANSQYTRKYNGSLLEELQKAVYETEIVERQKAKIEAELLGDRIAAVLEENPDDATSVRKFFSLATPSSLERLRRISAISDEQAEVLEKICGQKLSEYADKPDRRQEALIFMNEFSSQITFLKENVDRPTLTRAYADLILLSIKHPTVRVPLEKLRYADEKSMRTFAKNLRNAALRTTLPSIS